MKIGSQARRHGWSIAIGLALLLTLATWWILQHPFGERTPIAKSRKTLANSESLIVKAPASIATQNLRHDLAETLAPRVPMEWESQRSQPTATTIARIEPSASVKMAVPGRPESSTRIAKSDVVRRDGPEETDSGSAIPRGRMVAKLATEADLNPLHIVSLPKMSVGGSSSLNQYNLDDPGSDWNWNRDGESEESIGLEFDNDPVDSNPTSLRLPNNSNGFPIARSLLASIQVHLEQARFAHRYDEIQWGEEVESVARKIASYSSLKDLDVIHDIEKLESLALEALSRPLHKNTNWTLLETSNRVSHAAIRRTSVWKAVWSALQSSSTWASPFSDDSITAYRVDLDRVELAVKEVRRASTTTGDTDGWNHYLLLDVLDEVLFDDVTEQIDAPQLAREILARISWQNGTKAQRDFLASSAVRELAAAVQPMAVRPINYSSMLADLEMVEENTEHRARHGLVSAIHSLRYADQPDLVAVSQALDTYYRNANLRVAVSSKLINRFLPTGQVSQRPVRQNILGADTRGNSNVETSLRLTLNPDASAWNMILELDGKIHSNTKSSRGPAVFYNASNSNVATSRTIRIDTQGIQIEGNGTSVVSDDDLRGMNTQFDGLPIVGDVVRYYAQREFNEMRGPAKRIVHRSIASQTNTEFDKQLNAQITSAEMNLEQRLIGPLRKLNMTPMLTDMSTTSERLIARYRFANDDALAANTPRPRAPGDSVLSLQVHQSALNNGFAQLGLSSQDWTLADLARSIADQLGQDPDSLSTDELPTDVIVRFEQDRPLSVEFNEGRMWLTLRIATLAQPGRIELNHFVIRTSYVPAIDGLDAQLIRDGVISVDGQRMSMRDRLPLRAIFAKVFAAQSNIPLVNSDWLNDPRSEGLAISQILMEDGWMGLAVSETESPHVAYLQNNLMVR